MEEVEVELGNSYGSRVEVGSLMVSSDLIRTVLPFAKWFVHIFEADAKGT